MIPKQNVSSKNAKVCLVEIEVRRSNRLKVMNQGCKTNSYSKVNYLGCSNKPPPIIPASVIRILGAELCQIDPKLLTDENLSKKRVVGPIGSKKKETKEKGNKKKDEDRKK